MKFKDIIKEEVDAESSDYPMEIKYQEGMKSTWKRKVFKTEKQFDAWLEKIRII